MQTRMNSILIGVSTLVGFILGRIGGPAFILVPWGVVGLVIGVLSTSKKIAIISGAAFGFAAAFTFMLSGYNGEAAIITRLFPFVIIGLVGAVCGLLLALVGSLIRSNIRRKASE